MDTWFLSPIGVQAQERVGISRVDIQTNISWVDIQTNISRVDIQTNISRVDIWTNISRGIKPDNMADTLWTLDPQ